MEVKIAYNKSEVRKITRAFKAMDEEATIQARKVSNELATFASDKIKQEARTRYKAGKGAIKVADGVRVSKSSKIGEFSYGFASQKFSGGGTTKELWPGLEFGSKRFKQFPTWSGRYGRGSLGYFIHPTLRRIQPEIINKWETAFEKILKEYG